MKEDIIRYINEKIKYLEETVVTDGVHNIPINQQVIDLLNDIKKYILYMIL